MKIFVDFSGLNNEQKLEELVSLAAYLVQERFEKVRVNKKLFKLTAEKPTHISQHPELDFENHMKALKQ